MSIVSYPIRWAPVAKGHGLSFSVSLVLKLVLPTAVDPAFEAVHSLQLDLRFSDLFW